MHLALAKVCSASCVSIVRLAVGIHDWQHKVFSDAKMAKAGCPIHFSDRREDIGVSQKAGSKYHDVASHPSKRNSIYPSTGRKVWMFSASAEGAKAWAN